MEDKNNIEKNNVGDNKNSSKVLITLFVIALFIIVTLIAYILFFNKPTENGTVSNNDKQTSESKKLYHIVDGDDATIWDSYEDNILVSFDYPQFDIDSKEIENINLSIKDAYQKAYSHNFKVEVSQDTDIPLVIEKDGKYYCDSYNEDNYCEFEYIIYDISEGEQYLAISFTKKVDCHCGVGQQYWAYFIDKETKRILTNSEIVKKLNKNEQFIINEYNEYIDNIGCYDDNTKASMKAKTIDDIKFYIENNELLFVKTDGCA